MSKIHNESIFEAFLYETQELIEKLELCLIEGEKGRKLNAASVNEIFRIMHTIKGSSSMMSFHRITDVSHSLEDLFSYIRDENPIIEDYTQITDLVFEVSDFINEEIRNLELGNNCEDRPEDIITNIQNKLNEIRRDNGNIQYTVHMYFEEDCQMIYMRAFTLLQNMEEIAWDIEYFPFDLLEGDNPDDKIKENGLRILFISKLAYKEMYQFFIDTPFIKLVLLEEVKVKEVKEVSEVKKVKEVEEVSEVKKVNEIKKVNEVKEDINESQVIKDADKNIVSKCNEIKEIKEIKLEDEDNDLGLLEPVESLTKVGLDNYSADNINEDLKLKNAEKSQDKMKQNMVSVNVNKLDMLMNLVGEIVISEEILINSPDLAGLKLINFQKSAMQLQKITNELKEIVMSIRMVPLSIIFQKMNRIVRDMSRKLDKDIEIILEGEETEVDKNIIEKISDPIMHIVRNAIDHGIETKEERLKIGKLQKGIIRLEAKNVGGYVLINIHDDGKGLNKERIIQKAKKNGLLHKPVEDLTEKEIYSYIFHPGFSTKDNISEYSGRGVGMDVVARNIENIGGTVLIDSAEGKGTAVQLKLPLTLAIVEGMNIKVGSSSFTIPANIVQESFRPVNNKIIISPEGNEMIMIREELYPIIRLNQMFRIADSFEDFNDGMMIMIEQNETKYCLFCDSLLGLQQVVVKALPKYLKMINKMRYFGGCTLLGDGTISLILDLANITCHLS